MKCESTTYFKITGDFDPDLISQQLNLKPDEFFKKGQQRLKGKGIYTFSMCIFSKIIKKNNLFIDEQMIHSLEPLADKVELLKELKEKYDLSYTFEVVPVFGNTFDKPVISPPKEVIDFCYLTDTLFDIDYYFDFDVKD